MALLQSLSLPLGTPIIDFSLPGIDGKTYSPKDFFGKKILAVVFTCNHCPYAKAAWPLLIALAKTFEQDAQFVAINPNDSEKYPDDSFESMKTYAKEIDVNFPYLCDASQEVAKTYQAQCTPDIYVYDRDRKLAYHGRINDNWQEPEKVTREDLKIALEALRDGRPVPEVQLPSMGCSIKWKA